MERQRFILANRKVLEQELLKYKEDTAKISHIFVIKIKKKIVIKKVTRDQM